MEARLKIGVRELVEFCCRSGDLGYDNSPGVKALDGLHIHQKIQTRYRDVATAEYPVKQTLHIDGQDIELGGRIDLLFAGESPPRIEEIKTVYAHAPGNENDSRHWAQVKCYAACYAGEHRLEQINISLNLVNLFSAEERRHAQSWSAVDLHSFVDETLRQYLLWHRLVEQQRKMTRRQARTLAFPFTSFRGQQHRFAAEVYRSIQKKQRLMVEAPTGSGKTISTLFPSVKAIGEDQCDQVIYLSAKISGQNQAVKAIELMIESGLDLSYLVIQAKARSCPCNSNVNEIDDQGRCLRCLGFFDRLPRAREALFRVRRLGVEQIQATAAEYSLCPFELCLQMLPWVDIVICDFNYVFDPLVRLGYFKNDKRRKVLLIDELHNLIDRARSMYSASLTRAQIRQASSATNSKQISTALKAMQQALDKTLLSQREDQSVAQAVPDSLLRASYRFSEKLGYDLFANKHIAAETVEFSRAIFRFQCIGQLFGPHHRAIGVKPLKIRELKLLCLNAFDYLHDCYPLFHSVCGFSATLSPARYFEQALGFDRQAASLSLESVFPQSRLKVCIGAYIDTRYRQREFHIDSICHSITRCYRARPGNYLVFFSSYYFMQAVYDRFGALYRDIDTLLQQRDFDESAQQQFLSRFFETRKQLGFAIMGGRFAEGIDYRGDALIGAILVGVGLPQANREQQLIQQDFETMQLDGFDYAFRFPGLVRVKQSAGRVIRSEQDRGVVVLLDRRFQQVGYRRHLPAHWNPEFCRDLATLEQSLKTFWGAQDDTD